MSRVRQGDAAPPRFANCGVVLALAGLGVFLLLGWVLVQILCYGPGGVVPFPRYPG